MNAPSRATESADDGSELILLGSRSCRFRLPLLTSARVLTRPSSVSTRTQQRRESDASWSRARCRERRPSGNAPPPTSTRSAASAAHGVERRRSSRASVGPGSRRGRPRAAVERLVLARAQREDGLEGGHLEDVGDRFRRNDQQTAAEGGGGPVGQRQGPRSGRVDELHPGQIRDQRSARAELPLDRVGQRRRGGQVDLARVDKNLDPVPGFCARGVVGRHGGSLRETSAWDARETWPAGTWTRCYCTAQRNGPGKEITSRNTRVIYLALFDSSRVNMGAWPVHAQTARGPCLTAHGRVLGWRSRAIPGPGWWTSPRSSRRDRAHRAGHRGRPRGGAKATCTRERIRIRRNRYKINPRPHLPAQRAGRTRRGALPRTARGLSRRAAAGA